MATNAPFTPLGNTVTLTAATSAPAAVQALSTTLGGNQYRIINAGTQVAFMGVGSTAAAALANAVVASSSQGSIPLLPNTDEIFSFVPNAWFTAITSTSTTTVYVTPGDGQ